MLKEQQIINLTINKISDTTRYPHEHLIEIKCNNLTIAYDMLDGYNFNDMQKTTQYLQSVDYYFKRSYNKSLNKELFPLHFHKIFPLGFNYYVTYPNNPITRKSSNALINSINTVLEKILHINFFLCTPKTFEIDEIKINNPPKILFCTRLWDGNNNINEMRINIIKELKKRYPDIFFGGIQDSPLSRKMCPELILPKLYTIRQNYIRIMKKADICIGSTGLYKSIGWKTGEYIAASKAIVNEMFNYEVPGQFEEGKNYYSFTTVDECLNKIKNLIDNPQLIKEMKINNKIYYNKYLKPNILVLNTLKQAKINYV